MKVLVTGAYGFIGSNLIIRLSELDDVQVLKLGRGDGDEVLAKAVAQADAVVHLAGENRPLSNDGFYLGNTCLTRSLCDHLRTCNRAVPVLFTSSIQAELDNLYGRSKLAAEEAVEKLSKDNGNPVAIYRLPGVFGKWSKPNYNSVVSTFCFNIANDLAVQVNDPGKQIRLVYIDDVINNFIAMLRCPWAGYVRLGITPEYKITLGDLERQITAFKNCRSNLVTERVGTGLTRALYATYVSYLPKEKFGYHVPAFSDARGIFVEMLRTPDSGQFSFFTAPPGVTRGGHYHHTKTEKFLVIRGKARFRFRNILMNEFYCLEVDSAKPQVVETVPGWAHDITSVGGEELVVMLWANEIFDRANPDTIASRFL